MIVESSNVMRMHDIDLIASLLYHDIAAFIENKNL